VCKNADQSGGDRAGQNGRGDVGYPASNTFVEDLEKSGFMKESWGGAVPAGSKKP